HFDYVSDPVSAVDGGDGKASINLSTKQEAMIKAMATRLKSHEDINPVTGAELAEGEPQTKINSKN
ncbi:manganese catalase family protein, partial [Escherichia coli O157]|nr:manganese catalase family protein [Escherichia coli O157]MED6810197.1 manganese catalase family protein [Escherichia coli O157]